MEEWKDVPGYDGKYQVSSLGNVRSTNWRGTGQTKNLFLKKHNQGYLQVELAKDGRRKTFTVHRLVAICFVDGYIEGLVVNHKNENRMDNRAEYLEWCSQSYNTAYTACHLYRDGKRKAFKCRAPILQLDMNMNVIRKWNSPIEIKHTLGFNDWSIKQCCLGKRKQSYGYLWQFAT